MSEGGKPRGKRFWARFRGERPWFTTFDGFNWIPTSPAALLGLGVVVVALILLGTWLFGG